MATLYKRATAPQVRILRAVAGAVRNVAHAHPDWNIHPLAAKSIAKRATGTLTAQWPDVLAAHSVPSEWVRNNVTAILPTFALVSKRRKGGDLGYPRSLPLSRLWKTLASKVRAAKIAGQTERVETLIEVLKLIASMQTPKT